MGAGALPGGDIGVSAPDALPSPRGAHLEMVGAVLAGDGVERIAEIASQHAGAPVAVVVPRLAAAVEGWEPYERYVAARIAGGRPERPSGVTAEVPIASGGNELGLLQSTPKVGRLVVAGRDPDGRVATEPRSEPARVVDRAGEQRIDALLDPLRQRVRRLGSYRG